MAAKRRSKRKRAISENEVVLPVVTKGMVGGKYKPLSDHEIEQIHQNNTRRPRKYRYDQPFTPVQGSGAGTGV